MPEKDKLVLIKYPYWKFFNSFLVRQKWFWSYGWNCLNGFVPNQIILICNALDKSHNSINWHVIKRILVINLDCWPFWSSVIHYSMLFCPDMDNSRWKWPVTGSSLLSSRKKSTYKTSVLYTNSKAIPEMGTIQYSNTLSSCCCQGHHCFTKICLV